MTSSRSAWLCPGMLLFAGFAWAQANFTAQLRGTVKDESSAVVPNASVTITNEATGAAAHVTTDGQGRYTFTSLQPAAYTITVTASGFSRLVQSGVTLRVSQESNLDLTLKLGSTTSTVDVKSDAVLLNLANAELGQEITSRYITEMPLFNRQIEGCLSCAGCNGIAGF